MKPMDLGKTFRLAALALAVVLAPAILAAMDPAEMIKGQHWNKWTERDKLVYIRGLTNWADFITEAQVQGTRSSEYCMSKAFVDELKSKTLGQIVAEVNAYYMENPGKMNTSVVEVLIRRCTTACPPEAGVKEGKK